MQITPALLDMPIGLFETNNPTTAAPGGESGQEMNIVDERTWEDKQDSFDYEQWKAEQDWKRANKNSTSMAHSFERVAESLERMLPVLAYIHVQLGNIHQTLITPDTNGEPVTVADLLKCMPSSDNVASLKTELAAALGDIIAYRRMRYADSAPEEARYRELTGKPFDDE